MSILVVNSIILKGINTNERHIYGVHGRVILASAIPPYKLNQCV